MQRLLLFLGFMALGTGTIYMVIVQDSTLLDQEQAPIPVNVMEMKEVVFKQQDGNNLKYELFAENAVYYDQSKVAELEDVLFFVYEEDQNGQVKIFLEGSAGKALMNNKQGKISLFDDVYLLDSRGVEIKSERLDYEEKKERLISPGKVWIKAKDTFHQGTSMIYDIPKQQFTLGAPKIYQ